MKKILFVILVSLISSPVAAQEASGGKDYSQVLGNLSARITALEEENRKLYGRIEELEYNLKKASKKASSMDVKQNYYVSKPGEGNAAAYVIKVPEKEPLVEEVDDEIPFKKSASSEEEAQFNEAFSLIGKQDYPAAKKSLAEFIANNPDSEYTAQSHFWLGEIAQKEKAQAVAAVNYLKSYKLSPQGKRAAESLVKLAQSLAGLGKKEEACKNIDRFNEEFPNAHFDLKAKAENAKLECK